MSGFSYRRSLICGYYHELMAPLRKLSSRAHSRARDDQYLWRCANGWTQCAYGSVGSFNNCRVLVNPDSGSDLCSLHAMQVAARPSDGSHQVDEYSAFPEVKGS